MEERLLDQVAPSDLLAKLTATEADLNDPGALAEYELWDETESNIK